MVELSCSPGFFNFLAREEGLVLINSFEELSFCVESFLDLGLEDVQPLLCFGELNFLVW
jgi:hypothetical protein